MKDSKATQETLSESVKMYQMVTERLENSETNIEFNHELVELILDLYDDDEDFPYQKLRKFSITEIIDYLQATHRYYLTKKLPEIEQSLIHIFSKYGQSHELLSHLALFFNEYKNHLIEHIKMEEKAFFPYIKKLMRAAEGKLSSEEIEELKTIAATEAFNDNHDPVEDELKEVNEIINKYSKNENPPLPYRIFLNQVQIFELELRKHAIIEDHVLLPLVLELEKKVFAA